MHALAAFNRKSSFANIVKFLNMIEFIHLEFIYSNEELRARPIISENFTTVAKLLFLNAAIVILSKVRTKNLYDSLHKRVLIDYNFSKKPLIIHYFNELKMNSLSLLTTRQSYIYISTRI